MGVRGIVRDFLTIYLGIRLIGVWVFGAPFTNGLGMIVIFLLLMSVWFLLQRVGMLP